VLDIVYRKLVKVDLDEDAVTRRRVDTVVVIEIARRTASITRCMPRIIHVLSGAFHHGYVQVHELTITINDDDIIYKHSYYTLSHGMVSSFSVLLLKWYASTWHTLQCSPARRSSSCRRACTAWSETGGHPFAS
jgi:hypothetical protein